MRSPVMEAAEERGKVVASRTKVGLKRGPWTPEEDALLASFVRREGEGKWRTLPKKAGLQRCGKSCRLRWMNYLRPSVKRGQITPDEEDLILRLHRLLGNRWSLIAGRIPGRTDNEIKNYWNTHLSKRLISQGIDPRTHKPLKTDLPSPPAPPPPPANPTPNPNHHPKPGQEDVGRLLDLANPDNMEDLACGGDALFASFLDCLVNNDFFQQTSVPYPFASETPLFWEPTSVAYSTEEEENSRIYP